MNDVDIMLRQQQEQEQVGCDEQEAGQQIARIESMTSRGESPFCKCL